MKGKAGVTWRKLNVTFGVASTWHHFPEESLFMAWFSLTSVDVMDRHFHAQTHSLVGMDYISK